MLRNKIDYSFDLETTGLQSNYGPKKVLGITEWALRKYNGGTHMIHGYTNILRDHVRNYRQGTLSASGLLDEAMKSTPKFGGGILVKDDISQQIFFRNLRAASADHAKIKEKSIVKAIMGKLKQGKTIGGWNVGFDFETLSDIAKRHGVTDFEKTYLQAQSKGQIVDMSQGVRRFFYEEFFGDTPGWNLMQRSDPRQFARTRNRVEEASTALEHYKKTGKFTAEHQEMASRFMTPQEGFTRLKENVRDIKDYDLRNYSEYKEWLKGASRDKMEWAARSFWEGAEAPSTRYVSGWSTEVLKRTLGEKNIRTRLSSRLGAQVDIPHHDPRFDVLFTEELADIFGKNYSEVIDRELKAGKNWANARATGRLSLAKTLKKHYNFDSVEQFQEALRTHTTADILEKEVKSFVEKHGHLSTEGGRLADRVHAEAITNSILETHQIEGAKISANSDKAIKKTFFTQGLGKSTKSAFEEIMSAAARFSKRRPKTAMAIGVVGALAFAESLLPDKSDTPESHYSQYEKIDGVRYSHNQYQYASGIHPSLLQPQTDFGSGREWFRQFKKAHSILFGGAPSIEAMSEWTAMLYRSEGVGANIPMFQSMYDRSVRKIESLRRFEGYQNLSKGIELIPAFPAENAPSGMSRILRLPRYVKPEKVLKMPIYVQQNTRALEDPFIRYVSNSRIAEAAATMSAGAAKPQATIGRRPTTNAALALSAAPPEQLGKRINFVGTGEGISYTKPTHISNKVYDDAYIASTVVNSGASSRVGFKDLVVQPTAKGYFKGGKLPQADSVIDVVSMSRHGIEQDHSFSDRILGIRRQSPQVEDLNKFHVMNRQVVGDFAAGRVQNFLDTVLPAGFNKAKVASKEDMLAVSKLLSTTYAQNITAKEVEELIKVQEGKYLESFYKDINKDVKALRKFNKFKKSINSITLDTISVLPADVLKVYRTRSVNKTVDLLRTSQHTKDLLIDELLAIDSGATRETYNKIHKFHQDKYGALSKQAQKVKQAKLAGIMVNQTNVAEYLKSIALKSDAWPEVLEKLREKHNLTPQQMQELLLNASDEAANIVNRSFTILAKWQRQGFLKEKGPNLYHLIEAGAKFVNLDYLPEHHKQLVGMLEKRGYTVQEAESILASRFGMEPRPVNVIMPNDTKKGSKSTKYKAIRITSFVKGGGDFHIPSRLPSIRVMGSTALKVLKLEAVAYPQLLRSIWKNGGSMFEKIFMTGSALFGRMADKPFSAQVSALGGTNWSFNPMEERVSAGKLNRFTTAKIGMGQFLEDVAGQIDTITPRGFRSKALRAVGKGLKSMRWGGMFTAGLIGGMSYLGAGQYKNKIGGFVSELVSVGAEFAVWQVGNTMISSALRTGWSAGLASKAVGAGNLGILASVPLPWWAKAGIWLGSQIASTIAASFVGGAFRSVGMEIFGDASRKPGLEIPSGQEAHTSHIMYSSIIRGSSFEGIDVGGMNLTHFGSGYNPDKDPSLIPPTMQQRRKVINHPKTAGLSLTLWYNRSMSKVRYKEPGLRPRYDRGVAA